MHKIFESWQRELLTAVATEGKSAINLDNLGKFFAKLDPGFFVMLGRLAASKIIHVRLVGGPANTWNKVENPNMNNLV